MTPPDFRALHAPIALRAYALPKKQKPASRAARKIESWPESVLLLDTETSTDPSQRLLFGTYRYARWATPTTLRCVEEGLFYADELPTEDPAGFAELECYARRHQLPLMSRHEFVVSRFYPAACGARALVVGFNLPFDLSRLALGAGEARGPNYGGFSFWFVEYEDRETGAHKPDPHYARVCVKHVDSKRAFISFAGGREPRKGKGMRGRFLDLKTLAFALTNVGHSLASACAAFGVAHGKLEMAEHGCITPEYITYNRRDVEASQELLEQLRREFDRHPVELDPCHAYSPASIAKAYLRAFGVTPPLEQFPNIPPAFHGIAMSAYFGGRAEARIRLHAVPVMHTDFLSMYPTVNALMGLWDYVTAESLELVDATEEVSALLARVTPDEWFARAPWRALPFFARIRPRGDILPVRAQYASESDAWNIGVNPLTADFPVWVAGPDLVASALLMGRAPELLEARRLVPRGRQSSLKPLRLRGQLLVDPRGVDFFRAVIEMRKSLGARPSPTDTERARLDQFLKVLANSGSYGVFAEMNRRDLPSDERADVILYAPGEPLAARTRAPETHGALTFPPFAALITAAARLMLALLERAVTDLGGAYAFCDTDSMAIVATERGGLIACPEGAYTLPDGRAAIRALSWDQVRGIVARFEALSPYDRGAIPGSILKVEEVNFAEGRQRELFAYVISAKRYALFNMGRAGRVTIRKASEHGLGHLLSPLDEGDYTGWETALWDELIARALAAPR